MHSYQLRSRIPRPPNAFMLFAQEKRRSVAAENPNENNQRVSSRFSKRWRSLSAADKEPYQRTAAEAAPGHRRKHPDYVYNPREAHRCKWRESRTKAIASKPKSGSSRDQEQQPSISMAMAKDRGTPECQHPPVLPQRNEHRGTSTARGSTSGAGHGMSLLRTTATVTVTASAHSAVRPYNVHRFPGPLPPSLRGANRENTVPTHLLTAAGALKQPKTPYAPLLDNQPSPTFLEDKDDESSAGHVVVRPGRIPGHPRLRRRRPIGEGHQSSSAAGSKAALDLQHAPVKRSVPAAVADRVSAAEDCAVLIRIFAISANIPDCTK
ncbi:hypothetical protein HPB49_009539 [Dermacentor silvarum]|uniref:Uncharacterized protein n=1 Tax=Dermacentor silvarum TaxID=543639 RepID=A0ACB8DYP2_DERSI|nr:transcription factor SOX-1 [Dermacentor silvarum]KAH7979476.1 hypothetical protein HPB49_009539 [Dermacentor silvarum]